MCVSVYVKGLCSSDVVCEFEFKLCHDVYFLTNTGRKGMNNALLLAWFKSYDDFASTRIDLVLNNAKSLICH